MQSKKAPRRHHHRDHLLNHRLPKTRHAWIMQTSQGSTIPSKPPRPFLYKERTKKYKEPLRLLKRKPSHRTGSQGQAKLLQELNVLPTSKHTRMTVPKLKPDVILLVSCRPRKSWRTFRARRLRELKGLPSWLKFNKTVWFSTRL